MYFQRSLVVQENLYFFLLILIFFSSMIYTLETKHWLICFKSLWLVIHNRHTAVDWSAMCHLAYSYSNRRFASNRKSARHWRPPMVTDSFLNFFLLLFFIITRTWDINRWISCWLVCIRKYRYMIDTTFNELINEIFQHFFALKHWKGCKFKSQNWKTWMSTKLLEISSHEFTENWARKF